MCLSFASSHAVYLIFGTNKSGRFYGYVRMATSINESSVNVKRIKEKTCTAMIQITKIYQVAQLRLDHFQLWVLYDRKLYTRTSIGNLWFARRTIRSSRPSRGKKPPCLHCLRVFFRLLEWSGAKSVASVSTRRGLSQTNYSSLCGHIEFYHPAFLVQACGIRRSGWRLKLSNSIDNMRYRS